MKRTVSYSREWRKGQEIEDSLLTLSREQAATIEPRINRGMIRWGQILGICALLVLAGRVLYLNVWKGSYYRDVANGNRIRQISIKAPRGKMYDRFGTTLVQNVPSIDVVCIPADFPQDEGEMRRQSERLASVVNLPAEEIIVLCSRKNAGNQQGYQSVVVKKNISQEETLILAEHQEDFLGVRTQRSAVRQYIDGMIFSHLLGFEGKIEKSDISTHSGYELTDTIGKQGVEKSYESFLHGKNGSSYVEIDARGVVKKELAKTLPTPGADLYLHLDSDLQKKLFDTITDAIQRTGSRAGAAVAINPRNGGVLAMVSVPSYDNNLFTRGILPKDYLELVSDERNPLFNRAVSGEYAPGSTLKPLIAMAGLAEGIIQVGTQVESRGGISVGGTFFGDWKVHGFTDVRRAIAVSSDVFFYAVGGGWGGVEGLGMSRMKRYEEMYGLGKPLGIDIPGEEGGFIPDEDWKLNTIGERWYKGNSYHAAIGQGYVTTTPLQIATFTSAIANGGTVFSPRVVSHIRKQSGEEQMVGSPVLQSGGVNKDVLQIVREGMRMTVTEGTAQMLKDLPVEIAGKTGTAQIGGSTKTHAWFSSFAPFHNPEVAMVVLLEEGGESTEAVRVTKDVLEWYFGAHKEQ